MGQPGPPLAGEGPRPALESLPARFFANARRLGAQVSHFYPAGGRWYPVGWRTAGELVRDLASGLIDLGHQVGDPVAIVSPTRREWLYCDLATLSAGGVTVGIYPTLTPAQWRYIIDHAEARYCVVEDQRQLAALLTVVEELPRLRAIVVIDPADAAPDPRVIGLDALLARGRAAGHDVAARVAAISSEDAATFIYTSGTTGPPKGAMMTHGGIVAALHAFEAVQFGPGDFGFSFLPLAHALQRAIDYTGVWRGVPGAYARGIPTLAEDLVAQPPTVMVAVPRIFEKIFAGIHERVRQGSPATRRIFDWACRVGAEVSRRRGRGEPLPPALAAQYRLARRLVYDPLRAKLGGRIRLFISGGAPIATEILEFFDAAGITILEGWGMTETFSAGTVNLGGPARFGSVGRPLPGVDLRLDDDGEILIKGRNLFSGYYKEEEATAAAFTPDGYFRTGDIGRVDDGYYYLVDRKKDLIITAGGKNVAPQNIENAIKTDPRISQAVVIGDRRPYLVALVSLADEVRKGLSESEANMLVESIVAKVNLELPRFEQIKKFRLLPHDLTEATGELTPTLKVKRRVVNEEFAYLIDEMYD